MALLWADGFDHYGDSTTGRANMLLGVYGEIATVWTPLTTLPRNSLRSMRASTASTTGFRRSFGSTLTTVGVGGAAYLTAAPASNTNIGLVSLNDANNDPQVTLTVQTAGAVEVKRGDMATGTSLGVSATQPWTVGTWHHFEMEWVASSTVSATDGTVTVYIDGVEVLAITGVDNVATALREASQAEFGMSSTTAALPWYFDDIFAWDSTGSYNNTFLGDKDILPYYYDADGATEEWALSTGADSYALVDETAQDGDTTYIQADNVNDITLLELAAVPSSVSGINAVVLVNMMRKTAAGASAVTPSLFESGGASDAGAEHALTQSYTYYHDVIERNPAAGTPAWTYTTLSAAYLKLERTV